MARITLGLGTSHSPQLSTPAELWPDHADRDKHNPMLYDHDGVHRTYEELIELAPADIAKQLTPDRWEQRYQTCQDDIARVGRSLSEAGVDVLIMVGDDQHEMFNDDNMPAMSIFWGEGFTNMPRKLRPDAPKSLTAAAWGNSEPEVPREYPVASDLGLHLIEHLNSQEFDIAHTKRMPERRAESGMGHAFGFIYRRVMERVIPTVPILVNTYYPPNQPTPHRCADLGRAIRGAVEAWDEDIKVGIIASGGLTHFVIDEEFDERVLKALREHDLETLETLPLHLMNSGNSEIRNWVVMAGATEHLDHQWSDYVPCYRSPAATGCAMGFGAWA